MTLTDDKTVLLDMTVGIVANYVSNNRVSPDELAGLISSVHNALGSVGEPVEEISETPERLTPSAIRKLITPNGIRSLIDGRVFKSMKRHLTLNGWTPRLYREHFGLPKDFPMVHPEYSRARSAMAKSMGLGSGGRQMKKAVKPVRKPPAAKA
ncbi:MucR family transcriptional regulator [Brevundimonas sp. SL161]|uniref:MucR family transcriptional regulator n=1 Tax=Brevundimonas sp. SL161 TaxID=2804613 RepID=UPI003CF1B4E9